MKVHEMKRQSAKRRRQVAAYCRVSTELSEQEESYERQISYYEVLIKSNPGWDFAGVYADRGRSGTSTKARPAFRQMVQGAMSGRIDLILVKSISRFSRNAAECEQTIKNLAAANVEVRFEKEGISSFEPSAGFVFSLLAAVAQDESQSISENVRWRYANRFAKGDYNIGSNRIFGYDSVNGKLIPNAKAWVVKRIFALYLQGKSLADIEKTLTSDGILGLHAHSPIKRSAILSMLRNETYVGDKRLQKKPPTDFLTKRPNPHVQHISYDLTDDHEAIIDRATWEQVQMLLHHKQEEVKQGICRHGQHHPLYGKLFCGLCGAPYTRRTFQACQAQGGGLYKAWNCRERQKGAKGNGCRNRIVKEDIIMEEIEKAIDTVEDREMLEKVQKVLVYEDHVDVVMT
ncbi:MAG: recombinase family protein [Clostridia bacterium]|nr:recombinase family protein [Clostridia bacterium]